MLLFFLVFLGFRYLFFSAVQRQVTMLLPRSFPTRNSFSLLQNGKNSIRKRTSAEERPFSLQRGYSHSASLHAHEQNCFVILFI